MQQALQIHHFHVVMLEQLQSKCVYLDTNLSEAEKEQIHKCIPDIFYVFTWYESWVFPMKGSNNQ